MSFSKSIVETFKVKIKVDHTCKRDAKELFSIYYWAWCWNYQDDVLSLGHAEKSNTNDYHNSPDLKKKL